MHTDADQHGGRTVMSREREIGVNNNTAPATWPAQVSIWAGRTTLQGMAAIATWTQEHWGVKYKKAALLKLAAAIAVQLVKGGLVVRRGLHFAVTIPVPTRTDYALLPGENSLRGQRLSVSGPAIADLEWLENWLWRVGTLELTRSDAFSWGSSGELWRSS